MGNFSTEDIKELKSRLPIVEELMAKKLELQRNIPSYTDKKIQRAIKVLENLNTSIDFFERLSFADQEALDTLINFNFYHQNNRFQSMAKRRLTNINTDHWPQGMLSCLSWKNLPLIKTVEDYAVIPLIIQNLRPRTIIEIGSGSGASALWMADHLQINNINGKVYSIDIHPASFENKSIEFIKGDAKQIEYLIPKKMALDLPHPWLIVDDAHQTIQSVLAYFEPLMHIGDYVYVEDSFKQQEIIGEFLMIKKNSFLVDTFYTDFFGRNSVSAKNSILKK
ncbi:hypothetical protein GYB57_06685 [bacterium]|nr:hypothetical protein [bacterium]